MTLLSERPSKNIPVVIDDNFSELEVYAYLVSDFFKKKKGLAVFYTWGLKIITVTYLMSNTRGQKKCCLSKLLSYSCIFLVCRHVLL